MPYIKDVGPHVRTIGRNVIVLEWHVPVPFSGGEYATLFDMSHNTFDLNSFKVYIWYLNQLIQFKKGPGERPPL